MTTDQQELVRVGIIGAGASGLAQLKQVLDVFARSDVRAKKRLEVVVYEKNEAVGGVWLADESLQKPYTTSVLPSLSGSTSASLSSPISTGPHPDGMEQLYQCPPAGSDPSPMYNGLRTNLPHDLMAYRELPMSPSFPVFPSRAQIHAYLTAYADTFRLHQHIRLRTTVTRLHKTDDTSRPWRIQWMDSDGRGEEEYDFVCCANGHYADGWIPEIPGLNDFRGDLLHSRYFRSAEDFKGKHVLVVGSFASGGDISRLLAAYNLNQGKYTQQQMTASGLPTPQNSAAPSPPLGGASSRSADDFEGIRVHVSCPQKSAFSVSVDDPTQPWGKYVTYHPLISHISNQSASRHETSDSAQNAFREKDGGECTVIHFEDETELSEVDAIIFATGYNFALPFAKKEDAPWRDSSILDGVIRHGERNGGNAWEEGGVKGLAVKGLDELMLFLDGDRSLCFPVLQYQIVPFPMAETQTRLSALLWAGLLPSFPAHPRLPSNPSNPYSTPPSTPGDSTPSEQEQRKPAIAFNDSRSQTPATPNGNVSVDQNGREERKPASSSKENVRKVVQVRQKLVFGAPYEWVYQEYLFSLMKEAGEEDQEEFWSRIEEFRKQRRADTGLRKRELGY